MSNKIKVIISCVALAVLIGLDQLSKLLIVNDMSLNEKKVLIDGFFSLHYVQNTGSAFSFLADKSWGIYVLSGISLLFGLFTLYVMIRGFLNGYTRFSIAMLLVTAGAFGNLIDRFRLHYVVDFLRFDFGSYTFPIFNVADSFAVVGSILLIIFILVFSKEFDGYWNMIFSRKVSAGK
ncbi:signal peptidase II [Ruminococcaceae bacterium YRB3002]|nr:signal peptidase II [Ruminococcaceae bacterium YRB3002]